MGANDEWDCRLGTLLWFVGPIRRVGGRSPTEVLFEEAPKISAYTLDLENTEDPGIDGLALEEAVTARLAQRQALKNDVAESLRRFESAERQVEVIGLLRCAKPSTQDGRSKMDRPVVVIEARDTGLYLKLED